MPPADPEPPTTPPPVPPGPGIVVGKAGNTFKRINGYLHRVVPIVDAAGRVVNYAVQPVMVEFKPRDLAQIVVGAVILGVPVMLSDEAMSAAEALPGLNIGLVGAISVAFIAGFVYLNFYRNQLRTHWGHYLVRVLATYVIALAVVAGMLELFQLSPWADDPELALRRTILVTFPASLFATIADTVK